MARNLQRIAYPPPARFAPLAVVRRVAILLIYIFRSVAAVVLAVVVHPHEEGAVALFTFRARLLIQGGG